MCHHSQPTCWPHAHSFFLGTGFLTTVSGHETLGGAQVRGPPPARTHVWDALKEQRLPRRHSPPMTLPSSEQVQKTETLVGRFCLPRHPSCVDGT